MIPTAVAREARENLLDYLQTTYGLTDPEFERALFEHLNPGGQVALADLDTEEGDFHPPDTEGVYHAGFDRDALAGLLLDVGFVAPRFVDAASVDRDGKRYPIFLAHAAKPG